MVLAAIIALLAATDLIVKEWIERQKPESFRGRWQKQERGSGCTAITMEAFLLALWKSMERW